MNLFSKEEVNNSRQFEFDFAKAVCILGMVFVHCYEHITLTESGYAGSMYYVLVTILNTLFGAGTFMICLGVGLEYTHHNKPENFIKRGIITFLIGYLLNLTRYVLPSCLYFFNFDAMQNVIYLVDCLLYTDIMQFAGLAFLIFGLLKKIKVPDWGIGVIALVMSIAGSFIRFIDVGPLWLNEILGLFIGTVDESITFPYLAHFSLLNWFIFVVFGYYFGKLIKRCNNIEKFYAILTPVSATIVITYMVITIPNKLGMMSGIQINYFQMTTYEALLIIVCGMFAFGLYHYISKIFNEKIKNFITGLSVNINKTYCIHYIIIGWVSTILWLIYPNGISSVIVFFISIIIYIVSSLLAEVFKRMGDKKKNRVKA